MRCKHSVTMKYSVTLLHHHGAMFAQYFVLFVYISFIQLLQERLQYFCAK